MMKPFWIAALAVVSAVPAFAGAPNCKDESRFQQIDKKELTQLVDQKSVFVVDVNSKESFEKQHVPGAIHFESNKKNFAKMLPEKKDTLIVAYCGGPQCTAWKKAAIEACKLGYTNIKHFKPGISGWASSS